MAAKKTIKDSPGLMTLRNQVKFFYVKFVIKILRNLIFPSKHPNWKLPKISKNSTRQSWRAESAVSPTCITAHLGLFCGRPLHHRVRGGHFYWPYQPLPFSWPPNYKPPLKDGKFWKIVHFMLRHFGAAVGTHGGGSKCVSLSPFGGGGGGEDSSHPSPRDGGPIVSLTTLAVSHILGGFYIVIMKTIHRDRTCPKQNNILRHFRVSLFCQYEGWGWKFAKRKNVQFRYGSPLQAGSREASGRGGCWEKEVFTFGAQSRLHPPF